MYAIQREINNMKEMEQLKEVKLIFKYIEQNILRIIVIIVCVCVCVCVCFYATRLFNYLKK